MRALLTGFALGVFALEVVSTAGFAQLPAPHPPATPPPSLKTVPVPVPDNYSDFVKDRAAAIALGKALFWDTQVGSDGRVACASCHFQAGADVRTVNQLNPGANHVFDVGGPNHTYSATDFPFHQLANPDDRRTVIRSKDDVSGSQGVHAALFQDIVPGSARDAQMVL